MKTPISRLQDTLDSTVFPNNFKHVLEAGCGSSSQIKFPEDVHITGIDISQEELDKNSVVSEKIVGDIQTHDLPADSFDMIVCWDVLEHLPRPTDALLRFEKAVRPGSVILLAFPNVNSVKGIVTKLTPLWFHELVYKFIYGKKYGQPGLENFPTYLRRSISPKNICRFAEENNLSVNFLEVYESGVQRRFRQKLHIGRRGVQVVEVITKIFSLGMLSFRQSDCIILLRKPLKDGAS